MELIEDVVEGHCDTNIISGEKVWVMIKALADLKVSQFDSQFDTFYDMEDDDMWTLFSINNHHTITRSSMTLTPIKFQEQSNNEVLYNEGLQLAKEGHIVESEQVQFAVDYALYSTQSQEGN